MRDIKFRAWNIKNKKWIEIGETLLGFLVAWKTNTIFEVLGRGDCEIVQYTGIKDINGKEIYEGDIVSFYNDEEYLLEPGIAKIDFDCGGFMITNKYLGTEFLGDTDIDEMCIKVIGNIYENPELLEV